MRSVEEQLDYVLKRVSPLEPFPIGLLEARGCVVAEDITAPWPLPAFDTAATDGYAVRVSDVIMASTDHPVTLDVVDTIAVGGRPGKALIPGVAVRVSAGAALPEETEAIVPVEYTDGGTPIVSIIKGTSFGQYIRRTGEDVELGEVVVPIGTAVDARVLGLLAAVGRGQVNARPRPRVVIVSVGSELLEAGGGIEPGRVPDSNGVMLAAAVAEVGGVAYRVGPVSDDPETLERILTDQLVRADLVITTGGSSASAYDAVRRVVDRIGEVEFSRIAMYPGTALGFGRIGEENVPVLTLPGNPVAAFISFEVFVRPVLRRLFGLDPAGPPVQTAVLLNSFSSPEGRRHYVRAVREIDRAGRHCVRALEVQGTHLVASLARTECLIVVPEAVTHVDAGDNVDVLLLNDASVW